MRAPEPEDYGASVLRDMQHWLEAAVIGLQLCPFAKAVHVRGQIHYRVSRATEPQELLHLLELEMRALAGMDAQLRDTTLLILPDALPRFLDFNDFLDRAEDLLEALELDGVLQIASFHPQFQFAGTAADDITNATNRAPYPTLHLLREASVDKAVAAFPQADTIFEANMKSLQRIGQAGWDALGVRRSVPSPPAAAPSATRRRGRIGR
ncbi:MAG: DUF1415 domain-containing protein [Rhodoferax sp.]|nr:DUF1415 domain-containing protein [Rhodoferax sp.]